jgi:polyamine oxidase
MGDPTQQRRSSRPVAVIIVGAGAASIKLAHTLWQHQDDCTFHITIVEANDYIGGRVRNAQFEGHTVEMGANWLSGRTVDFDNPIWKLAQEIDLRGHVSDRENPNKVHAVVCSSSGDGAVDGDATGRDGTAYDGVITDEYLKHVRRFNEIYDKAVAHVAGAAADAGRPAGQPSSDAPHIEGGISTANDVSVRSILESFGWPAKDDLSDVERAVEHGWLEVWATERLEELGAAHDMKPGANDVDLGQDELFVEDPRGFNSIFEGMVKDLNEERDAALDGGGGRTTTDILLQHEVQSICYSPGNVKVVAKDLKTGNVKDLVADMVVSTVSVGVLQSTAIHFSPPLPDWKVQALNELKMFNFAKVYVKLPKVLWPVDKYYLVLVSRGEENRGRYTSWIRYKNVKHNDDDTDSDLMMCYLGGAEARRVELLSEEELKDELEQLFSKAFLRGEQALLSQSDCRPVSVKVTDWSVNPRFCGSYSCYPKGAFGTVPIENLRRSLTGQGSADPESLSPSTLYFAGEAFDDKFNGWVQGGYMSGERVGMNIVDACKAINDGKTVI